MISFVSGILIINETLIENYCNFIDYKGINSKLKKIKNNFIFIFYIPTTHTKHKVHFWKELALYVLLGGVI